MCAIIVKSFGSNNKVKYINEKEKKKEKTQVRVNQYCEQSWKNWYACKAAMNITVVVFKSLKT